MLVMLLIPVGVGLLFMFGAASVIFSYGKMIFLPEKYWSDEVVKVEDRIKLMGEGLATCNMKATQDDRDAVKLYKSMIEKGWPSDGALEILTTQRKAIKLACAPIVFEMLAEGKKFSEAKAELEKHSR